METLLDVLDALKSIFSFKFNISFDGVLFIRNQLLNFLGDLFPVLFGRFKPHFELQLSIIYLLFLLSQNFLFTDSIFVQILVDLTKLIMKEHVEMLLSLVNDLIELVLESGNLDVVFFNL